RRLAAEDRREADAHRPRCAGEIAGRRYQADLPLQIDRQVADRLLQTAQDRERDVEDRHPAAGRAAQLAAVGVAVDGEVGTELVERARKAGRAQKRIDLERFAFERRAAGRVMEKRDAVPRPQPEERLFELELLGDAGVDEGLERLLAEPLELRRL